LRKHINTLPKLNKFLIFILCIILACSFVMSGCGDTTPSESDIVEEETPSTDENSGDEVPAEEETVPEFEIDTEHTALYEMLDEEFDDETLIKGETAFDKNASENYGLQVHCLFDMPTQQLIFQCKFNQIPSSDDTELYLFAYSTWEDDGDFDSEGPLMSTRKGHTMQFCIDYNRTYLFERFLPALKVNGEYYPISTAKYISNPEILAPNQTEAPAYKSKKGLLIDPATVNSEKLTDLNIDRGIYNMPLSLIVGESTNPDMPTTEYEYDNRIYYFNTANLYAYDGLFQYLNEQGIYPTAIILNDWNESYQELIHPKSRKQTGKSLYYAFNNEEEEGVRLMEATALFLAERYSSGWYGMVYEWVIANEINQQTSWNYMDTTDIEYYTKSFERSFRIFYNAIKSRYSSAKVYFSIDHDWNDNNGRNSKWFNGKELLEAFNRYALEGGNYDWGLAIHPYPSPLTRVNFWSGNYDMTSDAKYITIMNLSTLTSVLEQNIYRNPNREVRSVAITELGFTSDSGEKLQAAAFAYCYYIIEANPYVESFMMNRQTDAYEEMRDGLSFGIYNPDLSEKYIYDVFKNIDSENPTTSGEYLQFMLNIIKADSLEEALSWAVP